MSRHFNTAGTCFPSRHYMAGLENKLKEITAMADAGKYFCISRARQYGKSTVLYSLARSLCETYLVISISFQRMSTAKFENEDVFCRAFVNRMERSLAHFKISESDLALFEHMFRRAADGTKPLDLTDMFDDISDLCCHLSKPLVLIIDEIDSACSSQIFLDFLGQIRDLYLNREFVPAFQSVILAGVYNIKNLKLKNNTGSVIRYNSPWNIADDFTIDISLHTDDIFNMLLDYEADHHTGMDVRAVSQLIFDYTDGYPYLVSRICRLTDERLWNSADSCVRKTAWTSEGILLSIRLLLKEPNTLFEDMVKHLQDYPQLKENIKNILFCGMQYSFEIDQESVNTGVMFGFIKEKNNNAVIANRIFEMKLYNMFLAEDERSAENSLTQYTGSQFISSGMLKMRLVMQKFYEYYQEIFGGRSDKFLEENGRRLFLMFLRPIINGSGNYYIEAETRSRTRTDVIIDYHGQQFIIELKIWHGEAYSQRAETQLFEYLEHYHVREGYLLSFNFNKNKKTGIREIRFEDKWIMETVV